MSENPEIADKEWAALGGISMETPTRGTNKDIKNADRSSEFIENKGAKKVVLRVC